MLTRPLKQACKVCPDFILKRKHFCLEFTRVSSSYTCNQSLNSCLKLVLQSHIMLSISLATRIKTWRSYTYLNMTSKTKTVGFFGFKDSSFSSRLFLLLLQWLKLLLSLYVMVELSLSLYLFWLAEPTKATRRPKSCYNLP